MNGGFPIGRIRGIAIECNWSLLVIFWLIAWSLADTGFPTAYPGHAESTYWIAALVTALVFFTSLLAHELGHALMAHRVGVRVESITLWLFGGVARLSGEAATPRAELQISLIGPAISFSAAAAFGLIAVAFAGLGAPELVFAVPAWLARINLLLAIFNLAPAAPLDGGRVLRAVLWARHGDRLRATATAAQAGRAFGHFLIALGLLEVAVGGTIGGLWFVFLGWFLLTAARAEEASAVMRESLSGLRVRDVMSADPVVAPASITVDELLEQYAMRHRFSSFPLVDDEGRLVGLLTLSRLNAVPPARRGSTTVGELAFPLAEVPLADPNEPMLDLLERTAGGATGRALVLDHDRLVGIVSPRDVARIVELAALRGTVRREAEKP